jgi:uncharacterized membrane protein
MRNKKKLIDGGNQYKLNVKVLCCIVEFGRLKIKHRLKIGVSSKEALHTEYHKLIYFYSYFYDNIPNIENIYTLAMKISKTLIASRAIARVTKLVLYAANSYCLFEIYTGTNYRSPLLFFIYAKLYI